MNEPRPPEPTRIDAYLDGVLSPQDRAAFERELSVDGALRAEVELQKRIDGRLRVIMAPPAAPVNVAAFAKSGGGSGGGSFPLRAIPAWAKVAAALTIAAVGAWAALERPWEPWLHPAKSVLTANVVMKRMVDDGFQPVWVCEDDAQFLKFTKEKLGVSFLVRPAQGVQVVGWTYSGGLLGDAAQVLLVREGGEPVIVAMGPASSDRVVTVEPNSGLNVRRQVHRGVVMYEISKLDHPVILTSIQDK